MLSGVIVEQLQQALDVAQVLEEIEANEVLYSEDNESTALPQNDSNLVVIGADVHSPGTQQISQV